MIVGFILSKVFGRSRPAGNTGDLGPLEERLGQANEGLGKFSIQLETQNKQKALRDGLIIPHRSTALEKLYGAIQFIPRRNAIRHGD